MKYGKTNILNKIISFIVLIVFEVNLCFSASYSGIAYTGKKGIPTSYSGAELIPIEYAGELLYPLSYSGTVVNGIYYEGINLSNYKITTLTITGHETDSDIFNESVSAEYRVNWKKVIGKYSVGTTIIVITGIVSLCSGTVPLATAGYIAAGAFKGAITGSIIGAATEAFFSATLAFFKGEPKEQIFKETIEASADGFMWGALTGAIAEGFKSAKELSKGISVLNSNGRIQYVVEPTTNTVYLAKGSSPVGTPCQKFKNGQYSFFQDAKGNYFDFDGIHRKIEYCPDGRIYEDNKIIGLLDFRDGLIAQNSEMENVVKDCWKSVLECKFKEGSYGGLDLGKAGEGRILKKNFVKFYGIECPKYAEGHHIVPTALDTSAGGYGSKLRDIFKKFNIDINDPHNCVLLPNDELRCKSLNMMKHKVMEKRHAFKWNTVHGNDIQLLESLYEDMSRCASREQVFEILADYRHAMMTNTPFWL